MQTALRVFGHILVLAAIACLVMGLTEREILPFVPRLLITGVVFLSLAVILERLARIENLLRGPRNAIGGAPVQTSAGDFHILQDVEGEAMCLGCRKVAPKAGLYYNKSLDVYYHPACLARDREQL